VTLWPKTKELYKTTHVEAFNNPTLSLSHNHHSCAKKMPSTPSTPNDDDDIFAAMDASSSPLRPTPSTSRKRTRDSAEKGSGDEGGDDDDGTPPPLGADEVTGDTSNHVNQNATAFAKRLASRKKLRKDQQADVEAFVSVSPDFRYLTSGNNFFRGRTHQQYGKPSSSFNFFPSRTNLPPYAVETRPLFRSRRTWRYVCCARCPCYRY
jgi:hypothetical protein